MEVAITAYDAKEEKHTRIILEMQGDELVLSSWDRESLVLRFSPSEQDDLRRALMALKNES